MTETRIVSYLMDGHFRATRHTADCAVYQRAEREWLGLKAPATDRYNNLAVYTEEQYARLPEFRAVPKDHRCVARDVQPLDISQAASAR